MDVWPFLALVALCGLLGLALRGLQQRRDLACRLRRAGADWAQLAGQDRTGHSPAIYAARAEAGAGYSPWAAILAWDVDRLVVWKVGVGEPRVEHTLSKTDSHAVKRCRSSVLGIRVRIDERVHSVGGTGASEALERDGWLTA